MCHSRFRHGRAVLTWLLLLAWLAAPLAPRAGAEPPGAANGAPEADGAPEKHREIYVPLDDLNQLLEGQTRRIILTRREYQELLAKARPRREAAAPLAATLLSADYEVTIAGERAVFSGRLVAEVLRPGVHSVPLPLSGVGVRSAMRSGKPVPLARDEQGQLQLLLEETGRHEVLLELVAPLSMSAARQSLRFQVPTPAAASLRLTVPGNVEVKSGADVLRRQVEEAAGRTVLELLPRRGEIQLELTLNNRLLRRQQVVIARSVLVAEVTTGYERLHASLALGVLHGSAERFRFRVPAGFEVTEVNAPQVARWAVETQAEGRVLEVRMREAVEGDVLLNVSALRTAEREEPWSFPRLEPLDVAGQSAVVGLLLEDRWVVDSLDSRRLIGIDASVLTEALPDSVFQADAAAPRVRPVAAYYAPQAEFQLEAELRRPPMAFRATANLLLTVSDREQHLRGQFILRPEVGRLFDVDFQLPSTWQLSHLSLPDGGSVPLDRFPAEAGRVRLRGRLPSPVDVGQQVELLFEASSTPEGWLGDWAEREIAFPRVQVTGAARQSGGLAVQPRDDLRVLPRQLDGLAPLDAGLKASYGLAGAPSQLAYRYERADYAAEFQVSRAEPRLTAQCYAFYHVEPTNLQVHYELHWNVQGASADRLSFELPADTPPSIAIRGLDGVQLKEFNSEPADEQRRWNVLLAERRSGLVRLAVDFRQRIAADEPQPLELPPIRAVDTAYQTTLAAVEGDPELDLRLLTEGRSVDVGELYNADYRIGRRLLGAYAFLGDTFDMAVEMDRRPGYQLPPAIVERAEMVTLAGSDGRSQTGVRFLLRTKAPFLELHLPAGSLWSVYLDGRGIAPQREGDAILISLPTASAAQLRDLQVVYESSTTRGQRAPADKSAEAGGPGELQVTGPKLFLRTEQGTTDREVPLADLRWTLYLPRGLTLTDTGGSVALEHSPPEPLPITKLLGALWGVARTSGQVMSGPWAVQRQRLTARYDRVSSQAARTPRAPGAADDLAASAPMESGAEFEELDAAELKMREQRPAADQPAEPALATPPMAEDAEGRGRAKRDAAANEGEAEAAGPAEEAQGRPTTTRGSEVGLEDAKSNKVWALSGVRSLDIHLTTRLAGRGYTFRSLGADPQLKARFIDRQRYQLPAIAAGLLVLAAGLALTTRRTFVKARFLLLVGTAALALPLLTPWEKVIGPACELAFYAVCLLIPYYLVVGLGRWCCARVCRFGQRRTAATVAAAAVAALLIAAGGASQARAQPPAAPRAESPAAADPFGNPPAVGQATNAAPSGGESRPPVDLLEQWLSALVPSVPLQIPEDAVVVPYDAERGLEGVRAADKLLVPYPRYRELWHQAHPDRRPTPAPPRAFAVSSARYRARLADGDSLLIEGQVTLDVLVEEPVEIPLAFRQAVLVQAQLDGRPARIEVRSDPPATPPANPQAPNPQAPDSPSQQPPAMQQSQQALPPPQAQQRVPPVALADDAQFVVHTSGAGRQTLELALRFPLERQGGWRIVEGRLPGAAATALDIEVPSAGTDVQLTGVPDRRLYETRQAEQRIATSLSDGQFAIRWRPRIAEGEVDQNLTAQSQAVLDVREDGLRMTWRLELAFRRDRRESFTLRIPDNLLIDRVDGQNVRGWEVRDDNGSRRLEVTLLKPAVERESLRVELSRREPLGDSPAPFAAPVVEVPDAILHQGRLLIRRSPLLDVRVAEAEGVERADTPSAAESDGLDASPLGLREFQAFQFAATPFTLQLTARSYDQSLSGTWEHVLRIAEHETLLESRLRINVSRRPLYQFELAVPSELRIDEMSLPSDAEWSSRVEQGRQRVQVVLKTGTTGPFSLVLRGALPRAEPPAPDAPGPAAVSLPDLQLVGAASQAAAFAVQVDPAYQVRAEQLQNCRTVLPDQLRGWLDAAQMPLTRLALRATAFPYAGRLRLIEKQPQVSGFTVSNVRVTDRTLEETILLHFTVREAGVQQLSFLLPAWMREARIDVPLLRQKTIEPVEADDAALPHGSMVRVRLELQEALMGQLRVLIQHERLLSSEVQSAPLPVVETGRTDQTFVTLENAGLDEVVVVERQGLEVLRKGQADWRKLTELLGDKLTEAYILRGEAEQPQLTFQTRERPTVETPTARIGLGVAELILDSHGAYRCRQSYQVRNETEQYLEVELPAGARLWTVHVAGEPVKPSQVPGSPSDRLVRVPIIKTDAGDDDYTVTLKYGGTLGPLGTLTRVNFPLARTSNIRVEINQVRLRLPEQFRWLRFSGSARRVRDEAEFAAGYLEYKTRQIQKWTEALGSSNPFRRARASSNLKQVGEAVRNYQSLVQSDEASETLRKQAEASLQALQAAEQRLREAPPPASGPVQEQDHRGQLNTYFLNQSNSLARNVVEDLGRNFELAETASGADGAAGFNRGWLEKNQLQNPMDAEQREGGARIGGKKSPAQAPAKGPPAPTRQLLEQDEAMPQGKGQPGQKQEQRPEVQNELGVERFRNQTQLALERYQQTLQMQQQGQAAAPPQGRAAGFANSPYSDTAPTSETPRSAYGGGFASGPGDHSGGMAGGGMPGVGGEQAFVPDQSATTQPGADPAGTGQPSAGPGASAERQLAELEGVAPSAAAGLQLASLDIDLPERGNEFLFTTRDQATIQAIGLPETTVSRGYRLLLIGVVAMMLACGLRWLERRRAG